MHLPPTQVLLALGALVFLALFAGRRRKGKSGRTPEDRKATVLQVNDQATLLRIALSDPDSGVRVAAIGRLTSTEAVDKVLAAAKKGPDWLRSNERDAAFLQQRVLRYLNLRDAPLVEALRRAECSSSLFSSTLVALIDESSKIAIARSSLPVMIRACATKTIRDQAVLADLAVHAETEGLRSEAAGALSDATAIMKAFTDAPPDIRRVLTGRIADQAVLARLAETDPDGTVRESALKASARLRRRAKGLAPGGWCPKCRDYVDTRDESTYVEAHSGSGGADWGPNGTTHTSSYCYTCGSATSY
jgi:hypothetical protein